MRPDPRVKAKAGHHLAPVRADLTGDAVQNVRRFYLRDYEEFDSDSDTNDFSTYGRNLLQYTAAAFGSRDFRQDMDMFNAFMKQAQDEYQNLLVTTRKDNATGSLTVTSTLFS